MFITFKVDNNRNDYTNTYNYITSNYSLQFSGKEAT